MPITLPNLPGFRRVSWNTRRAVARNTSPFTYSYKTSDFGGQQLLAEITLPLMKRPEAMAWVATLTQLQGTDTFYFSDPLHTRPLGNGTGAPLVNGASQLGASLITDGWAANTEQVLKSGDWLSIDDLLYMQTVDADSDASGNATLTLFPDVQVAFADNAEIKIGADARGTFEMINNGSASFEVHGLMASGLTLQARHIV